MSKIIYTTLENIKVGDQLYLKYNFGMRDFSTVTRVSKTIITDDKGNRWRRSNGYETGYRWSRATMAHWTAYKFLRREK